jgi:CheY-like chemotaxis protein
MDGLQAARRLRRMHEKGQIDLSHTIIVGLSAITEEQFKETKDSDKLFDSFMEKPVNFEKLKMLIH